MIVSEAGAGPVPAPPLSAFKEHLRLAHGFADDGAEDALLTGYCESAVAVIERRIGLALVRRPFEVTVSRLERCGGVRLPLGPVISVTSAVVEEAGGTTRAHDVTLWSVEAVGTGAVVTVAGRPLPPLMRGERLRVGFTAGLAADWASVPQDLAQAVMMLAADFHARRGTERTSDDGLPAPVRALFGSWRPARL